MRKMLMAAAVMVALPMAGQAQTLQYPGFYAGVEGGLNWLLNTSVNVPNFGSALSINPNIGWAAGAKIGYDFVGPRVELEGNYRDNTISITAAPLGFPNVAVGGDINQWTVMANVLYDFFAGQTITPYIGAGAGVAFVNASALGGSTSSTQFAYQGILGVGWNINESFRLDLDGRYYGTTSPTINNPLIGGVTYQNNNISLMLGLTYKFGAPSVAAAPPPPPMVSPPSFMVFFDWDRSNLSAQALNTIKQAAQTYKTKGTARITATGHTDTSGPEAYNMALSLRRANTVKDALVREGVPATAISVVGRGKQGLLVQTADGVREPQNRRVEIVIQ
ncbi:MAG: OmpA family protein [Reyranellales bacterium]